MVSSGYDIIQLPMILPFCLIVLPLCLRSLLAPLPDSITATQPFSSQLGSSDILKFAVSSHYKTTNCSSLRKLPSRTSASKLCILLLLTGDVALNPGPTTFAFTNARSIRNTGPAIV